MDVITVGNVNAQEAVLAIKVLTSFGSAKEHSRYSAFTKCTYLQCTLDPNFKAECQYMEATQRPHHTPSMADSMAD